MKISLFKILVGSCIIATVVVGYFPEPQYLIELTCISNMLGGLLLLIDGILNIRRKNLPTYLYLNVCLCIFIVFVVCMGGKLSGFFKFNFNGAFFFLHVINPILFIICYLFLCNDTGKKIKQVLTAPILMILYLLFDYIQCQFTGAFIYGFVTLEQLSLVYASIIGIGTYMFMCLLAFALLKSNQHIHKSKNCIS